MRPIRRPFPSKPPFAKATEGRPAAKTSWEPVSSWYQGYLKKEDTFQEKIVFPGALRLLAPRSEGRYLDIACGEGAFTRLLAQGREIHVVGIDAAPSLVEAAKRRAPKRADYEKLNAAPASSRTE